MFPTTYLAKTFQRVITKPIAAAALVVVMLAAGAFALTGRARWAVVSQPLKQDLAVAQPTPNLNGYVLRAALRHSLGNALGVLGDRLEKPGKERLTMLGTLRRQGSTQAVPCRLFLEWPRRVRLEEQGAQPRVYGSDGNDKWALGSPLSVADQEVIETLAFDSAEGFFQGQVQGFATRALSTRARADNGTTPNYTGPFYDIYQVSDRIGSGLALRMQPKLFLFNSNTLLLERVRYQIERASNPTPVEVQISGWQSLNGQQVPTSISRLEGGASVLTLTITSAAFGQRQNDGIFNRP
jgi:hypothetical protein